MQWHSLSKVTMCFSYHLCSASVFSQPIISKAKPQLLKTHFLPLMEKLKNVSHFCAAHQPEGWLKLCINQPTVCYIPSAAVKNTWIQLYQIKTKNLSEYFWNYLYTNIWPPSGTKMQKQFVSACCRKRWLCWWMRNTARRREEGRCQRQSFSLWTSSLYWSGICTPSTPSSYDLLTTTGTLFWFDDSDSHTWTDKNELQFTGVIYNLYELSHTIYNDCIWITHCFAHWMCSLGSVLVKKEMLTFSDTSF